MTQDVVQRSLSGLKEHHVHIINKDASVFGWLKQALPHEAKPKKPDLAKLFVHPISHPEGKSGSSSAASSLKSGKNKDLERKYGIVKSLVGEGGSSVVWMTRVKSSETVYALKSYRVKSDDKRRDFEENIVAEFKILSALDNPFIIKTFELLQDKHGDLHEILEICEAGDLEMLLRQRRLPVKEADCYFKQLFSGIHYLHSKGVVHRDIKPENLVLTKRGVLKIADFGHSEVFIGSKYPEGKTIRGQCGTPKYMAPELFTDERFAAAPTDCWAAGIVYNDMRRYEPLWHLADERNDKEYCRYLQERKEENGFKKIEELDAIVRVNTIYALLDPKAERRLSAKQFMQSEWAKEIVLCEGARCAV